MIARPKRAIDLTGCSEASHGQPHAPQDCRRQLENAWISAENTADRNDIGPSRMIA
jgi:hypothetical protein